MALLHWQILSGPFLPPTHWCRLYTDPTHPLPSFSLKNLFMAVATYPIQRPAQYPVLTTKPQAPPVFPNHSTAGHATPRATVILPIGVFIFSFSWETNSSISFFALFLLHLHHLVFFNKIIMLFLLGDACIFRVLGHSGCLPPCPDWNLAHLPPMGLVQRRQKRPMVPMRCAARLGPW